MTVITDNALMDRVKGGDKEAFGCLVDRHKDRLVSFLAGFIGDRDLAADIAQESFVRVYVHAGRYRNVAAFSTWLYRIGLNAAMDELKRRRRFAWIPLFKSDSMGRTVERPALRCDDHPEHSLLMEERKSLTRKAVSALPKSYRAALVLKDIEQLPYEEVARILNCPVGTIKSRINRARMLLKRKLEVLMESKSILPAGFAGDVERAKLKGI